MNKRKDSAKEIEREIVNALTTPHEWVKFDPEAAKDRLETQRRRRIAKNIMFWTLTVWAILILVFIVCEFWK